MPRQRRFSVEVAGMTDLGLERVQNQDSFAVRPDLGLFVVADGVANAPAGGLAAALAVREIERSFERFRRRGAPFRLTPREAERRLVDAFARADARVCKARRQHPQHDGMITTLAAMVVAGGQVVVGHVGDSRVYRLRGQHIERRHLQGFMSAIEPLTADHTVTSDKEWRATHRDDPDRDDPNKQRLLTRVIGHGEQPRAGIYTEKVAPEDTFLVCTDGLHGVLWNELLAAPFCYPVSLRKVMGSACTLPLPLMQCSFLMEQVKKRGAPDNVTLIVVRIKRGRGRWRTQRGIGWVVHAPPLNIPWVVDGI
jgi:serine/threonine protein phosphatase PrpC